MHACLNSHLPYSTILPSPPSLVLLGSLAVFRRPFCEFGPHAFRAVDAAANLSGRATDQPRRAPLSPGLGGSVMRKEEEEEGKTAAMHFGGPLYLFMSIFLFSRSSSPASLSLFFLKINLCPSNRPPSFLRPRCSAAWSASCTCGR